MNMSIISLLPDYRWEIAAGGGALLVLVLAVLAALLLKKKRVPVQPPPAAVKPQYPVLIGNAHHIGARENQQDCFGISDVSNTELCRSKGVFGVIADGMGGMADGAEASGIVLKTCLQYFNEVAPSGKPELDLLNMLYASNDNVNRFMSEREKGGSTVVAVIIRDKKLYWAAVGDSRICLIRNGAIMQVNREHTYAADLDKMAAMGEKSWEDAANDPKRAALTSYLGMGTLKLVDRSLRPMQLVSGDRVLLMSDGIFDALTDAEILAAMMLEPQVSAIKLQEMILAKQNPNQDNFTAIVFLVT
jgi:serine/threonine protein phosphatase PrpC